MREGGEFLEQIQIQLNITCVLCLSSNIWVEMLKPSPNQMQRAVEPFAHSALVLTYYCPYPHCTPGHSPLLSSSFWSHTSWLVDFFFLGSCLVDFFMTKYY